MHAYCKVLQWYRTVKELFYTVFFIVQIHGRRHYAKERKMKTVKDGNDLVVGKEYSDDGIRILIYVGQSKFFVDEKHKYRFHQQNYKFDLNTCEDVLISVTPIYFDEQQIRKLKYYD